MEKDKINACHSWAKSKEAKIYHDKRWCREITDENELFAMLVLEGMQAGLSWDLVLRKEKDIRKAFRDLDPEKCSVMTQKDLIPLYSDEKIIRNKNKINSVVSNAKAFLNVQKEFGSFGDYLKTFTGGKKIINHPERPEDIPVKSELSEKISADLKNRGFKFCGPVIIYSYLQAVGIINDHLESCPSKYE